MVVFTCNNCGDSLQKPKVEKHYSTVCRGGKSLTCVDCFKDFKNEEYTTHTKCITEEERYAAKGTIVGGVVKKGEVKQESWTEMIQSIIKNSNNVTHGQQKIFDIMSSSVNVPRKKNKFANFIKNAGGFKINMNDIEVVWNLIEKEKAQQSEIANNSQVEEKAKNEIEILHENGTIANQTPNNSEIAPENKPKKKKDKHVEVQEIVNRIEEIIETENKEPHKKKKKSKTANKNNHEQNINGSQPTEDVIDNTDSKKKRKSYCTEQSENTELVANKKIKSKKNKSKEDIIQVQEINPKITSENGKPNKKKSKKAKQIADIKTNENISELTKTSDIAVTAAIDVNLNNEVAKKMECETSLENGKIKKRKLKTNEQVSDIKKIKNEHEIENIPDSLQKEKPLSDFSFADKILNVLNEKIEVSLKTLQKKVLKEYTKQTGIESSPKAIKKFHKALKKISGVELSTDTVKLIN